MRPRIKPSAVLVAKSSDSTETLKRNEAIIRRNFDLRDNDKRPFVVIFGKKLYIQPNEIEQYEDDGFIVIQPK